MAAIVSPRPSDDLAPDIMSLSIGQLIMQASSLMALDVALFSLLFACSEHEILAAFGGVDMKEQAIHFRRSRKIRTLILHIVCSHL